MWAATGTITINSTQAGSANSTNFVLLVNGTYPLFASTANGGCVTSASGYDIEFYSDAARTVKLNWETESWSATGAVIFWIQIPTLSASANTVLYWAAGNAAVTTDQSNKTATWDSTYAAVWHLSNGTTLNTSDSTANANNGTVTGSVPATTGQIDGGSSWSGSASNYIGFANSASTNFTTNTITLSAWVKIASSSGYDQVIAKATGTGSTQRKFGLYVLQRQHRLRHRHRQRRGRSFVQHQYGYRPRRSVGAHGGRL